MEYEAAVRYCRKIAGGDDEARELLHDLYCRHGAAILDWDAPYLGTAVRNLVRDGVRRWQRRPESPYPTGGDALVSPALSVEGAALAHLIADDLAGTRQGRCLLMIVAGYSKVESGAILGCAPGTVGSGAHRARERAREVWA